MPGTLSREMMQGLLRGELGFNGLICIAAASAKQLDTCLSQGILSSASDTAADQYLYLMFCQESCQSTMAAAVCSYNF